MNEQEAAYHELCAYTLQNADARFIHQHVVDAYAAQTATAATKPIRLVFALVGLHLHLEVGKTGREVQLAHMQMARRKREWPKIALPEARGLVTAIDVMRAPAGAERERAIDQWCEAVWEAFSGQAGVIAALVDEYAVR